MEWFNYVLVGLAAMAAGMVNALAGGGTLITFPMLVAMGVPAVAANVTNTVALCPGYLGATLAQFKDLRPQLPRLWFYLPAGVIGGVAGGILLLNTGEKVFEALVPFLILLASGLLAISDPLRSWLSRHTGTAGSSAVMAALGALPIAIAGIYGGYFGAGLSVIVLAVLGLILSDSLTKLNALKQAIALSVNVAAAIFFVFSKNVIWPVAALMAVCALIGGSIGGRIAGRIKPAVLRWVVVVIGVVVAGIYLIR
ncbi:MAG: sulfite exporter TauE/SafE family protein [Chloroflexi bacterium]|nr:sulfite exporter TauE/SafE family protein [Chloroflexota bacterium]